MVVTQVRAPRGFNCRNCGAPVELRALTHTRAVACTSCGAVLDPKDPNLVVLQDAADRQRYTPLIPFGTRGTFEGHPYEVIGYQYRQIEVEGVPYGWSEYVLFNPYQGFRYLSEYNGHWNFVRPLPTMPTVSADARPSVALGPWTFRHFQTATAVTKYVLGEFPWRVRAGDTVETRDYIAPPLLLSSERTGSEITWSRGSYLTGAAVWNACGLPDAPPAASGVFANQPSPHDGRPTRYWRTFLALFGLLVCGILFRLVTADRAVVFDEQYAYSPAPGVEPAFVTEPFELPSDATLEMDLQASLNNAWLYLDLALLNTQTGTALNVGGEMELYSGSDADGPWTEGSGRTSVVVPWVPAGQYYLRVEPQGPTPAAYRVLVRRDVVLFWPYLLAAVLLLAPPIVVSMRAASFEHSRWQESDYGSATGGGDDDGDSDSDDSDGDGGDD